MNSGKRRVAVVTGAASGIGLACARALAAEDAQLVLVDRDVKIPTVAEKLGGLGLVVDLAAENEILAACKRIADAFGRVDVLINNAGIHPKVNGGKPPVHSIKSADWARVIAVNLTAPFLIYRELFPALQKSGSARIVNISSRAGRNVSPIAAGHYSASKAGLIGLSRVMALEGAPFGMTVNTVAPGPVVTGLTESSSEEVRNRLAQTVPVGRYGSADEVAAAVMFLCSPSASFVTGAALDVNGGSFMP
jgi:3-oxoacyl-[acyl-carrier protein] reductase